MVICFRICVPLQCCIYRLQFGLMVYFPWS
uniref:Uncharacterized protein n=1 Tax=Rhizophora mucronata TaxID=61149 RepID=A0A2P2K112_RHIMU